MKLLFILYDFYPDFGANSLIINNLSQVFIEKGHEVHILPLKAYPDSEPEEEWNNIMLHRITKTCDGKQIRRDLKHLKFISAFRLITSRRKRRFDKKMYFNRCWTYYSTKRLKSILNQYQIDVVVSVCYPFESCLPVMKYLKKNKRSFQWIIYMLDSFATNESYRKQYPKQKLNQFQTKVFHMADKIIVTNSIMNELKTDTAQIPLLKFKILNLPKIEKLYRTTAEDAIEFNRHYINCVYVGKLDDLNRNPDSILHLFEDLKEDCVRLHILGEEEEHWKVYLSQAASNIFFYQTISKEAVRNAQLDANILVNLGNSSGNQLPENLYEYISTGKPIVNLYQFEDCPTLEYLSKYPVHYHIQQSDMDYDKTLRKLRYFCKNYKHTKIKFKYIRKIYYDSTMDYVRSEFLRLCEDVTKEPELTEKLSDQQLK
jgi:heterodisulfide reductase subunit B